MVLAGWTAGSCTDGIDDDEDGFTDCEDPDCWSSESCACGDEEDNDGDGRVDCEDPDCIRSPLCCAVHERATVCCGDGIDNDGDGFADCEDDPDCAWAGDCCTDEKDNDGDGFTDCDDVDCALNPVCCPNANVESCACDDGEDNDGDGAVDCADADCFSSPACWDYRNSWFAEKIPYCIEQERGLELACDSEEVDAQLTGFDCAQWVMLHRSGLPGRLEISETVLMIDLGGDGVIDEVETQGQPLIEGPNAAGETVALDEIEFYDSGFFDSNISRGYWEVRFTGGEPNGKIRMAFLSDTCLEVGDACDIEKPSSWRRAGNKTLFFTFDLRPEGSRFVLTLEPEQQDYDSDGTDDIVMQGLVLNRK
jgi:hypothetical protein